ncbi:MAG: hypothetical protein HYV06_03225 [Deltaproteobacteria bacterium]|nr:hypothetical protein [Deltaproteobacteria bacterium]
MPEAVSFWLDNKMSSGIKVAEIGGQVLVSYRERFYVVEGNAAKMNGSKPLRFSMSSMPTAWKKAIKGISPPDAVNSPLEEETLPVATSARKERPKMEKPRSSAPETSLPPQAAKQMQSPRTEARPAKPARKPEAKAAAQTAVSAGCPYCNHKHELPVEKGRNGKAFLVPCAKCSNEFAVRYVTVTMYQAQVAGFR